MDGYSAQAVIIQKLRHSQKNAVSTMDATSGWEVASVS